MASKLTTSLRAEFDKAICASSCCADFPFPLPLVAALRTSWLLAKEDGAQPIGDEWVLLSSAFLFCCGEVGLVCRLGGEGGTKRPARRLLPLRLPADDHGELWWLPSPPPPFAVELRRVRFPIAATRIVKSLSFQICCWWAF